MNLKWIKFKKNFQLIDKSDSWNEIIKIKSNFIKLKLDSGSDVNVLPYSDFCKLQLP